MRILWRMGVSDFEVTCILMSRPEGGHEHITHLGHVLDRWCIPLQDAVRRILSRKEAYYTVDLSTGQRSYLRVIRQFGAAPYLQAYSKRRWNDSLLALQSCGSRCHLLPLSTSPAFFMPKPTWDFSDRPMAWKTTRATPRAR